MVTVVQSKPGDNTNLGHTEWSATLDSSPSQGNLLVSVVGFQQNGTGSKVVTFGNGFTQRIAGDRNWIGMAAALKLVGSSDPGTSTANITTGDSDSSSMLLMELNGAFDSNSVVNSTGDDRGTSFATTSRSTNVASVSQPTLLIPLLGMSGQTGTPSLSTGWTKVGEVYPGTANWHRACAAGWRVEESGDYTATWTVSTSGDLTVGMLIIPLGTPEPPPTGGDPEQLDVTVDGTTATLNWPAPTMADATHTDVHYRSPSTEATFDPENHSTRVVRLPIATLTYDLTNLATGSHDAQVFPVRES